MQGEALLNELEKRKLLRGEAVAKLRREASISGKSPEELIYERRFLDDDKLAELKSQLTGVPYYKIDPAALDEKVLRLIPEETVRNYAVAPLGREGDMLLVGMLAPDDGKAQEALKFIAQREHLNLGVYLISYGGWQEVLRKYSPYKSSVEAAVKSLNLKPGTAMGGTRRLVRLEEDMNTGGEEAPVIKIVADTFREAVQNKASDVHLEPQENYLRVRFRVDGELKETAALPSEVASAVISRVKVISNLKIDETRIPQDGRFRSRIFDREVDFRVATFPTPLGEKVAIRVLDPTTGLKGLDQLGLVGRNMELVKEGLARPYGMILLTGPTGSGKTTTLYALLQVLNGEKVNIVSLEDPVEYFVSGVTQSQVRPEIGYDFASGLRQILRQDPDVIMVGEVRDSETAELAVQAALTGHIVLSTLHTNNAAGVVPRLLDMKVQPFLLPASLNLMIGQRLVGQLCARCKQAATADAAATALIEAALKDAPRELTAQFSPPYKIWHSPGCADCKGRGIAGRLALFEIMRMTPELAEIISTGPTLHKVAQEAKRQGMISLRVDGVIKALQGLIAMEEVLRATGDIEV